jgi:hypothetical protein
MKYNFKVLDEYLPPSLYEMNQLAKFKIKTLKEDQKLSDIQHCFKITNKFYCNHSKTWLYSGVVFCWHKDDLTFCERKIKKDVPECDLYKCPREENYFQILRRSNER